MKNMITRQLLFIALTFGSFSTLSADLKEPKIEKAYNIQFSFAEDGRKWKGGYTGHDQLVELTEFFLEGETKENWTELVTTQYFFSRYEFSLETFFENFIKELAKSHPKNKIDSHIICCTPNNFFAEWWIKDKSPNAQHEWVHIFKENNAVGILRYTTKRMNTISSIGRIWENILANATFEKK